MDSRRNFAVRDNDLVETGQLATVLQLPAVPPESDFAKEMKTTAIQDQSAHAISWREPQRQMENSGTERPVRKATDAVRQGVTGHNVRYVLFFGLLGIIIALGLLAVLAG